MPRSPSRSASSAWAASAQPARLDPRRARPRPGTRSRPPPSRARRAPVEEAQRPGDGALARLRRRAGPRCLPSSRWHPDGRVDGGSRAGGGCATPSTRARRILGRQRAGSPVGDPAREVQVTRARGRRQRPRRTDPLLGGEAERRGRRPAPKAWVHDEPHQSGELAVQPGRRRRAAKAVGRLGAPAGEHEQRQTVAGRGAPRSCSGRATGGRAHPPARPGSVGGSSTPGRLEREHRARAVPRRADLRAGRTTRQAPRGAATAPPSAPSATTGPPSPTAAGLPGEHRGRPSPLDRPARRGRARARGRAPRSSRARSRRTSDAAETQLAPGEREEGRDEGRRVRAETESIDRDGALERGRVQEAHAAAAVGRARRRRPRRTPPQAVAPGPSTGQSRGARSPVGWLSRRPRVGTPPR